MSEHEWDVFVFLLSLSLFFSVCVCVSGAAWVGRLSFPRTALIENRAFERRRKNNRNSSGSEWKLIGTCACSPFQMMNTSVNLCVRVRPSSCVLLSDECTALRLIPDFPNSDSRLLKSRSWKGNQLKWMLKFPQNSQGWHSSHTAHYMLHTSDMGVLHKLPNYQTHFQQQKKWLLHPAGPYSRQTASLSELTDHSINITNGRGGLDYLSVYTHTATHPLLKVI